MLLPDVCLKSDVCLSHCLSRTSGLSRKQRGLGRPKLAQRQPTSHVTRHQFQSQKVKGQCHQAALLTPVLARRQLQRWVWERVGREKLLLRCRLLGRARHFGAHGGGEGRGISWRPPAYRYAPARLQLVTDKRRCCYSNSVHCPRPFVSIQHCRDQPPILT